MVIQTFFDFFTVFTKPVSSPVAAWGKIRAKNGKTNKNIKYGKTIIVGSIKITIAANNIIKVMQKKYIIVTLNLTKE